MHEGGSLKGQVECAQLGDLFRLSLGKMIPQQIILRFYQDGKKNLIVNLKACYGKTANLNPREAYGNPQRGKRVRISSGSLCHTCTYISLHFT